MKHKRRGYLNGTAYPRRKWGKVGPPHSARRRKWLKHIRKKSRRSWPRISHR